MSTNLPANLNVGLNWEAELKGANALLRSGLAPRDLKTPEACLFVILAGRDLGLSPVQSLRSIRPIQGKIECSADLQLGLFGRDGGKFRWRTLADTEVELELRAPWLTEPHISRWTMEDAKRAGLAAGDNWRKYPRAMLRSRAITSGLKDIGYLQGAGVYAPGEISGNAVVDVSTGEVLPTENQQVSEVTQISHQTSAGEGAEARVGEEQMVKIDQWVEKVQAAFDAKDRARAYALYKDAKADLAGDADQLVALRKNLDSKCRTALRQMADDELRASMKIPPPDFKDAIAAVAGSRLPVSPGTGAR